jgi:hypothetical protein
MDRFREAKITTGAPGLPLNFLTLFAKNANAEGCVFAEADFIAIGQHDRRRMAGVHVPIHLRRDTLADFFAVDEGAVEAAQVSDAKDRRHNFEDAMMA